MQITAEQADRVLKASVLKARELGISVCIAILDSGGHLKTFHRMDGAWLGVIDVAIKKAKTSALFEMETQTLDNYSKAGADAHGIELTNGKPRNVCRWNPPQTCAEPGSSILCSRSNR